MKPSLLTLTAAVATFGFAAGANAALIASDSFATGVGGDDYGNGVQLRGQSPTVGVTGFDADEEWLGAGTSSFFSTSTVSLTHSLVAGTTMTGSIGDFDGGFDDRSNERDLLPTAVPDSSEYYFSFLFQGNALIDGSFGLADGGTGSNDDPRELTGVQVGVGDSDTDTDTDFDDVLLYINGTPTTILTDYDTSTTYLALVSIIDDAGVDTITASVFADGDSLGSPAGTAMGTATLSAGDLDELALARDTEQSSASDPDLFVDEFRFGTELSDVVIPEPASLALLGLGGLMLLPRRKRNA